MAAQHLERARIALEQATVGGPESELARAAGLRELSRVLALNPADRSAFELLMQIVSAPTQELPPEAKAELLAVEMRDRKRATLRSAGSYLSWLLAVPEILWMGVRSWMAFWLGGLVLAIAGAGALFQGKTGKVAPEHMRFGLLLNFAAVATTSTIFGPLVFTPVLATAMAAATVVAIRANKRTRFFVGSLSFCAVFAPYLLQCIGVFPPSYAFEDGVIRILPVLVNFPPKETQFFLVAATAIQLVLPGYLTGRAVESLISAERQNFAQAFRLRQLLPAADRPETDHG